MTIDQNQQGNLPAIPQGSTGLEDFEISDAIIPRLSIQHRSATFKDNLSGQEFDKLRLVILGLVKQRILWYHIVDNGAKNEQPMCKSQDFNIGFPTQNPQRGKEFPWDKSGFRSGDFPVDAKGNQPLPCASCQLKEWGSHPNGNTPYCAEQWTLCVMYDPDGNNNWVPAYLTLQKSGLKPVRSYLTSFARSGRPAYTAICDVSLSLNSRGQVDYSTPSFIGTGPSDSNAWLEYSQQYESMRSYLTSEPEPDDLSDVSPSAPAASGSDNSWNAQPAAAPVEDPWTGQTSQQQAPPVQQQQAPPVQQQQAPPVQQQQAPPVQQPVPQQAPSAPAPQQPTQTQPPAQTPPPQGASPSSSNLPF